MSEGPQGPFWHDYNPWKDRVIYVTEQEWLDCLYYQGQRARYVQQMERLPFHDLYILPNQYPVRRHSMGMRVGIANSDYLSPYGDKDKIAKLITKYTGGADGT